MLEGVGRVFKSGRSLVIRVPVDVARDSQFPFLQGNEVTIQIFNGELRVTTVLKRETEISELMSKQ